MSRPVLSRVIGSMTDPRQFYRASIGRPNCSELTPAGKLLTVWPVYVLYRAAMASKPVPKIYAGSNEEFHGGLKCTKAPAGTAAGLRYTCV